MTKPKPKFESHTIENRKAYFSYEIIEKFDAGIELKGSEVKSIRMGQISLNEGYALITKKNEVWLEGVAITPYSFASFDRPKEVRSIRLLMHKSEIEHLGFEIQTKKYTLIPLKIFFSKGRAKLQLGLARGKKQFDKRESIKKRDVERDVLRKLNR